ncbi:MAG: PDGLE domain-containing protein [Elusimicrobiota bacterium]|jgi:hypothetical protein|nr:PDGLE domain-containing protein [Elusimicrobiota bacterium]
MNINIKNLFLIVFPAVVIFFASIFASSKPDALERVAISYNFADRAKEFSSLFTDYAFPFINIEFLSTFLAGVSGLILIYFLYKVIGIIVNFFAK